MDLRGGKEQRARERESERYVWTGSRDFIDKCGSVIGLEAGRISHRLDSYFMKVGGYNW